MHVHSIPMCECSQHTPRSMLTVAGTGKGNNYAYLVTDEPTKHAVVIDPANPPE
jgi:glyoxylase-like metal-dependent hydrolase (beta-lactamase superfamily II)